MTETRLVESTWSFFIYLVFHNLCYNAHCWFLLFVPAYILSDKWKMDSLV